MTTPLLTLTAAQLRATASEDEPPVAKPTRGRPRKHPPGEKPPLKPRLQVSFTAAERARWQAAADAAGLDLATWIRRVACEASEEILPPA